MSDSLALLVWIAKATAVLLVALGIAAALRRAPAGARHVVWLATLGALLLVPLTSTWLRIPLPILPRDYVAAAASPIIGTAPAQRPVRASPGDPRSVSPAPDTPAAPTRPSISPALAAWAAVAAAIVTWLLVGGITVRRIVRRARVLDDATWLNPLYDVADRLDLDNAPRLVMSSAIEMPFACGILQPTIVLPARAGEWSEERRRVVLFHELAHVRRRDLLGHTLGRFVCALYWFHPLVWSAAKRLRAESERACDDLVLACGGARASDYANHLLEIVTAVRRDGAPAIALPMANKREFEGRMLAILEPGAKRGTPSRAQNALLTVALAGLSLTIAAFAPTQRGAVESARQPGSSSQGAPIIASARRDAAASAAAQRAPSSSVRTNAAAASQRKTGMNAAESTRNAREPSASQIAASVDASVAAATSATHENTDATYLMQQVQKRRAGGEPADTALLGRILRTDKDARVRKAAAWALQGSREGIPLLAERLRADPDENVREMSAWALVGSRSTEVASALGDALKKDASEEVRATAAWGLGQMGGPADAAALLAALGDASTSVRERALWALGQMNLHTAPARVVELLKDDNHAVRLMAAWVLGEILDKSTIPALRDAFVKERHSETLQAELRALLFMGDRSQAVMDRAMSHEDPEVRARAVRMLAGRGPGIWPWPWPWPDPRPEP